MNFSNGNGNGKSDPNAANGNGRKKKRRLLVRRKRTLDPALIIDYKFADVLKRFITDRGKIIPRRISGATQEQQRMITKAIKRARFLSLIPSAISHRTEKGFAGEMQHAAQSFSAAGFRGRPMMSGRPGGPGPMDAKGPITPKTADSE